MDSLKLKSLSDEDTESLKSQDIMKRPARKVYKIQQHANVLNGKYVILPRLIFNATCSKKRKSLHFQCTKEKVFFTETT